MPVDANNIKSFDISNYLIELAKNRRKNFSFSTIKKKLSISDNQLELLEDGNIDFMPFPYNYHITKQYVEFVAPQETPNLKEEFFSDIKRTSHKSNNYSGSKSYLYSNLIEKYKNTLISIYF